MNTVSAGQAASTVEFRVPAQTKLVWGAMSQWGSMGVSMVLGLLIMPVIIRGLGKDLYGLWGLVASFVGFYGLFDFGLTSAVSRFLGNALGARDLQQFNQVAATGRCLMAMAAGLLVTGAILAIGPAEALLRIPAEYAATFRTLVLLAATSTSISMVMSIYGGALLASEDFLFLNCVKVIATTLRSFGSLAAVLSGTGVVGLAVVNVATTVVEQACLYSRCRVRLPQMQASLSHWSGPVAKALFGFASATFVIMMSDTVRSRMDVMLVTRFSGLAQAGLYSVGLGAFHVFFRAIAALAAVGWPRLNRLAGTGDRALLQAFFHQISHLTAAAACVLSGGLVGLAPVLIRLWVGPGYDASALVMQILTAGFFLDIATNPGIGSLFATARHRYFAGQTIVEAACSFSLSYILGGQIGMAGVALGIVCPLLVIKMTVQPWYVCRNLGISLREYWLRNIGAPLVAMAILVGGLVWARSLAGEIGLTIALLVAAGAALIAGGIVWLTVLSAADRAAICTRIARRVYRTSTAAVSELKGTAGDQMTLPCDANTLKSGEEDPGHTVANTRRT